MNYFEEKKDQVVWHKFVATYKLTDQQQEKFKRYFDLIIQENQKYNITAITSVQGIILDHFYDSLALSKAYDLSRVTSLCDVGSGGGFPGLPLALVNEHMTVHLVEVNNKKINFLQMVIEELKLTNVVVHTDDWRTFLRNFNQPIDIFTARASLQLKELLRIFKPSLIYYKSTLVYWASKNWVPTQSENVYLNECESYHVGEKKRSLCFFKA